MKKLLFIFPIAIILFSITTGQKSPESEKWNLSLPTNLYDPYATSSSSLPQANDYFKPFSETKHYRTPNGILSVSPNLRVLPRNNTHQSEVYICRHPINQNIMFGSSNAIHNAGGSLFISEGVYVTTNGGANWFGSDTLNGSPIGNHGGDPGPTIDKNGVIIMTHLGFSTAGMYSNYSTNNGATWSNTFTIATGSQDKNFAATDDAPSSPYYGRSYVVWSLFSMPQPPIGISYTTNSGISWTSPRQINTSVLDHYSQGCDIRVGPNGEVYVVWAAPTSGLPFAEDFLGFAKSTNGGVNWSVTDNAFDMNGIRGIFSSKSGIRVNSFPRIDVDRSGGPRNGWIYVTTTGKNIAPAGSDPDVLLYKSSNGGLNWSAGAKVNQDPLSNGKFQWFPAIRVDEAGGLNIVYYDDRNTASDSGEIYISRSIDGGITFTDILVSDHRFKPKPITIGGVLSGYHGDYIGITSGNGKLWPFWMDDITGTYQAWTAAIQIQTLPLNAFNLNTPLPGMRIQTLPNNMTNFGFTWDTSASTASYKWTFGNPTTALRKITLQSTVNLLNITSGQLDNILENIGVSQGDSLIGQWDVWAFGNNQTSDSLKSINGPRTITLKRAKPLLTPFILVSPFNNSVIQSLPTDSSSVNMHWTKSGEGTKYKWFFAEPNFKNSSNIKFIVSSNSNGFDSVLTIRNSRIDSMLAEIGINAGDSAAGQWRVYGYSGIDSIASSHTYNLTFRRGVPPTVSTSTDSIVVSLQSGTNTASRNLIIGNSGQFELDWAINEHIQNTQYIPGNNKIFTAADKVKISTQPKGTPDNFHEPELITGMGGPDNGGYQWIDSDETGGPQFNWVDISTNGTRIINWTNGSSDDGSVVVPLPFNFTYYGNQYSQIKICTNGWLSFDVASMNTAHDNRSIPSMDEPNTTLYVFWDDLDFRLSGGVYYKSDMENDRFIVQYKDAQHFDPPGGGPYTFQIIIHGDGRIYYQYLNMNNLLNSNTIGTENTDGTTGLQVVYNSNYAHNDLAIKLEKGLSWVDEIPSNGMIEPGSNQVVNVMFSSAYLSIGTYSGVLKISSNDPVTPVKNVSIKLIVGMIGVNNLHSEMPDHFELKQNYPNPFNPITKISYTIAKGGFVTLKIYNILGEEVETLMSEHKIPGFYSVKFDGSNLSSGLYFYKIISGSYAETKRMLLIK